MSSTNLFRPRMNGAVQNFQMSSLNGVLAPQDRRTSVISTSFDMKQSFPIVRTGQLEVSENEQEALAAPDMILKHGRISGLTWLCTFKDTELERLYRMFFYLDAHFHFQFLGLANIVWDALQIITYFATSKFMFVTDPISVETFTNFTCRSTICYENITNSSMCDTSFIHKGHPLTPDPINYPLYRHGALPRLLIHVISLIIFVSLAILWQLHRHPRPSMRRFYALLLWLILCVINYSFFAINPYRVPDDEVGFTQFIIFMTYTLIPVPLFWSLGLATLLSVFHMVLITSIFFGIKHIEEKTLLSEELFATFFILLAANLNGFYHNALYELSARRTFLTIRDSAKASILINSQYQKIKYLLLSIMPKYFYDKYNMSDRNFGVTDAEDNSNFKDLHVDHMEAVSILFADVVGFTKLSSSMEPRELVKLLNRLFGEFDDLAKHNNCLRIKILGDCYYCVSGVPETIPDHADNCVNMGLDMCNSIKRFQESNSPDLNMRVGVHSGHVFSGILGSKKFQFDIWSNDVTIANHMESGGVAGMVHISEATKNYLTGEYSMTNGHGVDRDALLKLKNVKTYLIKPQDKRNPKLSHSKFKSNAVPFAKHSMDSIKIQESRVSLRSLYERRGTADSGQTETEDSIDKQIKEKIEESLKSSKMGTNHTSMDKKASFSIVDTHSELNPYFLVFTDRALELKFHNVPDKSFKYYIISSWIVHVAIFIVQMIVHTSTDAIYFFVGGTIIMAILDSFYWVYLLQYVDFYPFNLKKIKEYLSFFSNKLVGNIFVRYFVSLVVIIIVMVSATINLKSCCEVENSTFTKNLCDFSKPLSSVLIECPAFNAYFNQTKNEFGKACVKCENPQYFIYNAILAMLVPSMFIGLNWIYKAAINTCGFILYATLHLTYSKEYFDQWDSRHSGICTWTNSYFPLIERGIYWILIEFLALVLFERVTERTNRIGFIWRHHSICKNEEHQQARDDHTHLLHNILPSHVAEHYLSDIGQGTLYSDRHDNACVMFASIPGFDTIYSEDDINHQGREWIRLLNEMFHEFDTLLEQPEFSGVEKIKTIGSTYMAATGLREVDTVDDEHIYTMAKFSFSLKEKLRILSDEALNDFEFRIGINCGPVVAGVICAEKPLFDIWGDTVNVASRMESTGNTGETQVTKKVEIALAQKLLKLKHKGNVFCKGKGELDVYLLMTPEGYYV